MPTIIEPWLYWILASSLCLSFYDLSKKVSVKNNAIFPTLLISTLSGWLSLSIFLIATNKLKQTVNIQSNEIFLLAAKSCIVAASWSATYAALKTLPITCAAPIRATGPLWTLIGAIIIFSEIPSLIQGGGMALVIIGCLFFSYSSKKQSSFGTYKAIGLAFAGTLLGSCSALYDKHLLQKVNINALTVLWWFLGGMCIIYAIITIFRHKNFQWRWSIPIVGILLALSDACYFNAIAIPDAQISILSLVRRSSIILTFFIGGALFKEKDIRKKAIALATILIGVAILCLAS